MCNIIMSVVRRCLQQVHVCMCLCRAATAKRRSFPTNSPTPWSQDVLSRQVEMAEPDSQPIKRAYLGQLWVIRPLGAQLHHTGWPPSLLDNQPTTCCHGEASPTQTRPGVMTGNSAAGVKENQTVMDVILSKTSRYQERACLRQRAGLTRYA